MIDTNVILDFFLSREPGADAAKQIFGLICQEKIDAFMNASSVTDIYYVTAKKLGDNAARKAIGQLLKLLRIIAVDGGDCANALALPIADYEDALISICADKEDIDYIVSNDKEFLQIDSQIAGVVSSQDFLNSMKS
jgi:predicted nucleic acid-binding protein